VLSAEALRAISGAHLSPRSTNLDHPVDRSEAFPPQLNARRQEKPASMIIRDLIKGYVARAKRKEEKQSWRP
jgi:hypothetical protein